MYFSSYSSFASFSSVSLFIFVSIFLLGCLLLTEFRDSLYWLLSRSKEVKVSNWRDRLRWGVQWEPPLITEAPIFRRPNVPYIFKNTFSLLIKKKESTANDVEVPTTLKSKLVFQCCMNCAGSRSNTLACPFLPSELEDDLLGEDLLSGKKVRNIGLETKQESFNCT